MNRFRKIFMSSALAFMMIISSTIIGFADRAVYETIEDEIISGGVRYKNIVRSEQDGRLNINVVYVDLKNDNVKLDVLTSSKGLHTKETLSTMVKNTENVVSAINGDFFYMLNPDSPLGAIVEEGEIISTPVTVNDFATFFVDHNSEAFVDYWRHEHWKNELYAETDSGKTIPISTINKYTDEYQYIMLIDGNWGTHSPGYHTDLQDMVEVVVVDDVVAEVRRKQPSVEIPENGYILLAAKGKSPWAQSDLLFESVEVGDKITVNKNIHSDLENIKLALGGGTILVKDGQVASFTQDTSGAHPRTAIGITKDRDELILVTIDGRHAYYKGVNGTRLAEILIELGSHEAIMMDGGGSTTMMRRGLGEFEPEVVNYPSGGGERRIINGLAVISTLPADSLKGIRAEADDKVGSIGEPRSISVKAFDKNYNPLRVEHSKVNLSLESGKGNFDGMNFIPTESGKAIINVEYLGAASKVVLDVLSPDVPDENSKFFVHSRVQPESYTLLDKILTNKISSLVNNKYELSLFTGDIVSRLEDRIEEQKVFAGSQQGTMEHGSNLIIQLDNSKDGTGQVDSEQLCRLQNLAYNTDKKNIFVLMSEPVFNEDGFTGKPGSGLTDVLIDISDNGKEVFVLYEGKNISINVDDGVKYMSTGVYNSDISKDPHETFKYIEFDINNGEVTYRIKSLFE